MSGPLPSHTGAEMARRTAKDTVTPEGGREEGGRLLYYAIEMRRIGRDGWTLWLWDAPIPGGRWKSVKGAEAYLPRWHEIHGDRWEYRIVRVVSHPLRTPTDSAVENPEATP